MYVVRSSDEVDEQIAQLLHDGAARFAELRAALELDPWSGDPYIRTKPDSTMLGRGRLRKAGQFLDAANLVHDPNDVDDGDHADAIVTLCVHAGIAAADSAVRTRARPDTCRPCSA